ncbi:hypothetical protein D9615_006319 [Tricholomella constricta]|uniref:GAG-pre-integrase domain-containing protein n=1 Tax=Tricholomella constricta TaxID=117010 RepID=A0A8H5M1G2_9AGAR|nr:hypothetical protein D9615_006319 [Tricholomella constricta]
MYIVLKWNPFTPEDHLIHTTRRKHDRVHAHAIVSPRDTASIYAIKHLDSWTHTDQQMSTTTAAAPDSRVPFARLSSNSNNWVSWILRAGAELKGKGVYLYATGKVPQVHEPVRKQIPSPTDPAGLAAHAAATQTESDRYDRELIRYLDWQTKDDLATSVIVKLIDETQDTSSSSRPPKTPGSRSSGTKEKCAYCKIEGHSEKVCRRKQREDTVRAEEREKMKKEMKGKHGKATAAKASTVSASRVPDSDDESSSDSDHDVKAHFTRERVFVTSLLTTESPKHVYMDSGASRHISPNLAMFDPASTRALSPPIAISTADGNIIHAKTEGTLLFDLKYDGKVERGRFERALHAPDLTTTLISVSQLTRTGIDVNFSGDVCNILDRTKQVIGQAHHTRSSLYRLTGKPVTTTETAAVASTPSIDVNLLHQRLGHLGHKNVQRLLRDKLVTGIGAVEGPET